MRADPPSAGWSGGAREAPVDRIVEPALFFWVFVHKHVPGFLDVDPRLVVLEQVDRFAKIHELAPVGEPWKHPRPLDVDLVALDRSSVRFDPLFNLLRVSGDGTEGRMVHQCLAYAYADTLMAQISIGLTDGWAGSLSEGWDRAMSGLRGSFDGSALDVGRRRILGASTVFWAMAEDPDSEQLENSVGVLVGNPEPRCARTHLGPLWFAETQGLDSARSISQDLWILLTDHTSEAEQEANRRYNQPWRNSPPDFAVVAAARHKIEYEWREHLAARERLGRMAKSLDRRADWLIQTQQYHGETISDLRSRESLEFQEKVARAHNNLADFRQLLGQIRSLHETVAINRRNFLVNLTALVSAEAADRVMNAEDQERAARELLTDLDKDEFFRFEVGRMQKLSDQIRTDLQYAEQQARAAKDAVDASTAQLKIASEREIGDMGADRGIETASIVSSLAALVAVEILGVGQLLRERPFLAANLILLAATGSFSIAQMISTFRRPKTWLSRGSFGMAVGFLAGALVSLWAGDSSLGFLWVNVAAWAAGFAVGVGLHAAVELRSNVRRRRRRNRKERVSASVGKLLYAVEELPELLEDLPPTEKYRLKRERSYIEKIERKNKERAQELGLSLEELIRRGEAYSERDIGDAIGVRYVIAPWRIEEIVERIKHVTHSVRAQYRDDREVVGRTLVDGRLVPDHQYRGKYGGFRSNYKSIHIDVDLWGVGAHKDVNLMGEVQVRTPLQNIVADWFHDIVYKPRPPAEQRDARRLGRMVRCARAARFPFTDEIFPELLEPGYSIQRDRVKRVTIGRDVYISMRDGRRLAVPYDECETYAHTAPRIVRFFDLWHPWLNRPLARFLIWLSDMELRLFRNQMRWGGAPTRPMATDSPDGTPAGGR